MQSRSLLTAWLANATGAIFEKRDMPTASVMMQIDSGCLSSAADALSSVFQYVLMHVQVNNPNTSQR
jgi:hypothetical protein